MSDPTRGGFTRKKRTAAPADSTALEKRAAAASDKFKKSMGETDAAHRRRQETRTYSMDRRTYSDDPKAAADLRHAEEREMHDAHQAQLKQDSVAAERQRKRK